MNLAERKKKFRQTDYWCDLDVSGVGFLAIFFVLFIILLLWTGPRCTFGSQISVDLARTPHAIKMPLALREDAIHVYLMRDGTIYCGQDKVIVGELTPKIRQKLQSGSERKVYIHADARTKYGNVNEVIDAIYEARIERVGLITDRPQDLVEP